MGLRCVSKVLSNLIALLYGCFGFGDESELIEREMFFVKFLALSLWLVKEGVNCSSLETVRSVLLFSVSDTFSLSTLLENISVSWEFAS